MPPNPAVSVLMTVYNTDRYLGQAVESVLAQTFGDFEFLIVDDGSTDQTPALLREQAEKDARIRLLSVPHGGIVKAANAGIAQAAGRYLARMDADDICTPERLAKQVAYLDAHPECVLVGSRVMVMDPYGSPVAPSAHKLTHEEIDAELLTGGGGWALVQPACMMRLEAVRAAGCYRGEVNMSEDHDLFLRLAERGRVANLPEVLLWKRRHPESVTHTHYDQMLQVKEKILREAYARRNRPLPAGWKFQPWKSEPMQDQLWQWGWAAIRAGNLRAARRHAAEAIRTAPLSIKNWKLMLCAIRGR